MKIRKAKKAYKRFQRECEKLNPIWTREQYDQMCAEEDNLGYDGRGKYDLYECPDCGGRQITTYTARGTTPFVLKCSKCEEGYMRHTATYQSCAAGVNVLRWVRPTYEQYKRLSYGYRQHIQMGGLILETEL